MLTLGDEPSVGFILPNDDVNHPFHWIIYPPRFYVKQIAISEKGDPIQIRIDEDMLDEYDIALYLIEHNDMYGILTVLENSTIHFEGTVWINGQEMPLRILTRTDS